MRYSLPMGSEIRSVFFFLVWGYNWIYLRIISSFGSKIYCFLHNFRNLHHRISNKFHRPKFNYIRLNKLKISHWTFHWDMLIISVDTKKNYLKLWPNLLSPWCYKTPNNPVFSRELYRFCVSLKSAINLPKLMFIS